MKHVIVFILMLINADANSVMVQLCYGTAAVTVQLLLQHDFLAQFLKSNVN
jgi:hypothetical protein